MTAPRSRESGRKNPRFKSRRRRILETLEPRCLLASLSGEVFLDANGDGLRGAAEVGAPSITVYLDANNNSKLDAGELSTTTDNTGQYQFNNLNPGAYAVRILSGLTGQSSPTTFFGSGYTTGGDGSGPEPTQLYSMRLNGDVTPIGSPNIDRIDGLVRTNDGSFFGFNDLADQIYSIDPLTGQETLLAQSSENLVAGLAYDPATDTIYTVSEANGDLALRVVNRFSGEIGPSKAPVQHDVLAMNFGSTFYDFDVNTGIATEVPKQILSSPFASTLDNRPSDGAIFGLQGNALNQYAFPVAGSMGTTISTLSRSIDSISFDAADQLFGVSRSPSALHQIDVATGVVSAGTPITFGGSSISVQGFDIGPDGTHYLVDATHLYTFNPATGIASRAANRGLTSGPIFTSLSAGVDGSLFATLFNTTTPIAQVDPGTGLATRLGNNPLGAPYASVVVGGAFLGLSGLVGANALTFDTVNQRIVGFADGNDQFFEFTTDGVGSVLATAAQPLNSSSLAFDGSSFVMFDDDDAGKTTTLIVDPDNGSISTGFSASLPIPTEALFHAKNGDVAQLVNLGTLDVGGIDFGLLTEPLAGVDQPDPGIYINELMLNPLFGNNDTDQYVELRGPAGAQLPDGTYLVVVDEDNIRQGEIHGIFDLSNQALGANGFLVLLQSNHSYSVDPESAVLESTTTAFSGLPGDIYTDAHPLSDRIDFILGPNAYFLIQSPSAPQIGEDIDADDDGLADPTGVKARWTVLDSLSIHPASTISNRAYGDIVLRTTGASPLPELTTEPGVELVEGPGSGYAGRIGDSIGSEPDDWVFGTARSAITDPVTGRTTVYELESGIQGVPTPRAFNGRDLDHLGESNFNGGIHGTVTLFPTPGATDGNGLPLLAGPAAGVTVFADTNDNGTIDVISHSVDPDDGVDPENLIDGNGMEIPQIITNAFDGVTITVANDTNDIQGFDVTAERETNGRQTLTNRIFAHNGIDFFPPGQRLRFDFYRPASEVSIEAIGSELGVSSTFGRLEAYDAEDQLIGSVVSGVLVRSARTTLTLTSTQEDIAYAVAYADETGSPFGRFDQFAFKQSEASAVTDDQGNYEIKHLFPGQYDVGIASDPSNGLIADSSRSIVVTRNENFEFDFSLRPNQAPVVNPTFSFTIAENSPPGTSVGRITATDINNQKLTYKIVSGGTSGLLLDEDTGELSVGPGADLNFEANSKLVLTVSVTDTFDLEVTTEVTVQLLDVNERPQVTVGNLAVAEGTENGTKIGKIQATDEDAGQTLLYNLIGGSGVGVFSVDPNSGLITLIDESAIDFESSSQLNLIVQVSDSFNPPLTATVNQPIRILDQNDPPVITTTAISVPENSVGAVGKVNVADPDVGQTHTFQLVGGSGSGLFRIRRDGTIEVRSGVIVDFEAGSSYTLDLIAVDSGAPPLASQGTVTVTILDVNEPPVLNRSSVTVDENSAGGTLVSVLQAVDPEGVGSGYVITMLDFGASADFDFDSATGELSVAAGALLDFETRPANELRFEIRDPSGNDQTTIENFVVFLNDQNDAPTLITNRVIISELAAPGTVVGRVEVQVREEDVAENVTVAIVGGNAAALFKLDAQSRVLTVANGAQFDADVAGETLILQVEVTDARGLSSIGEIVVELNDVNEPPVFTSGAPTPAPVVSGQPFQLVIPPDFVVDPEGREFLLAIFDSNKSLPNWLAFDQATRTLSGLPNPTHVGSVVLTLRAFEPGPTQLFNDVTFTVEVQRGDTPLTNQRDRLDVDANGEVAPLDALRVINFIGRFGTGTSVFEVTGTFTGFVDVSGDGKVTARDALLVINGIKKVVGFSGELVSLDDRDSTNDEALTDLLSESMLF